ncbi:ester cyclase [Mycobacterium hodleri]|uniref:Ester cyclase n=1 Tax=Mycolicibacterium hodleri TaxID=49897 RepID=A0A544W5I4_9MYCO|nr:ester cyclase [Mycolicibacterium hodleri]TQR87479.1 ester cyclase [Mycolicibacterium hodleri]
MTRRDDYLSLYNSYLGHCNEHDFAGMTTFYAPIIQINGVPTDAGAVTAQFAPLVTAFPDWHWKVRHLLVDGDDIVVHFTVTGTHRGTFRGQEATGRQVSVTEFTLYKVKDGKFAEVWDLLDTDAIIQQIG